MNRVAAPAAVVLLAACSRPAPATPPAPEPPPAAEVAAPPAPPAESGPRDLPVTSALAVAGEAIQPLARDGSTTIDPAAEFRIELPVALRDARLSLLDPAGAMVPASGGAEITVTSSRFTLVPDAPLAPSTDYALRLDGALAAVVHDDAGRAHAPASWVLRTSGEPLPSRRADRR